MQVHNDAGVMIDFSFYFEYRTNCITFNIHDLLLLSPSFSGKEIFYDYSTPVADNWN